MSIETMRSVGTGPADEGVDRLVHELLDGGDTELRALMMVAAGDPAFLHALVLISAGLNQLCVQGGRRYGVAGAARELAETIATRTGGLPDAQLLALLALTEVWAGLHKVVITELAERARTPIPEPTGLTQRQHQVLALLSDGLTVEAIARRLCLSPRTVGKHLERMYRRLGTSDRLSTVLQAKRVGLLAPTGRSHMID